MIKVFIDRSRCVGAGQCVHVAPEVFDQDDRDGLVVLVDASPPDAIAQFVHKAALACPAQAIRIEDGACSADAGSD